MTNTFPKEREEKRKFLLEAVESIRDVIEASADEAEKIRTLPKAAVDAIYDAGLFNTMLPESLGGAETDPVTQIEVIEAITRIDTSAGWISMIGAGSLGFPTAFLPDETIQVMFSEGRVPNMAGNPTPMGEAIAENGGYVVNGRWPYASGILHSDWLLAGVTLPNQDGTPYRRVVVLPASKAIIHDNWDVAGLKGTGSCDYSLTDLFVPSEFSWDLINDKPVRGGPLYQIRVPGFVTGSHIGFALGVGRRSLDEIVELVKTKRRGNPPSPLIARSSIHGAIGECDMKLNAAREWGIAVHEQAWKTACAGEPLTMDMHMKMRASATYATDVARHVASQAFYFAGASALFSTNVLQRCYRDIIAASQHFMVNDVSYENHGKQLLGIG